MVRQVNVPVKLNHETLDATISPGDFLVADLNGVVCIPKDLTSKVLEVLPEQAEADANMAKSISEGTSFAEASKMFRKKFYSQTQ